MADSVLSYQHETWPLQSNPALRTPAFQGHHAITDSLFCPWGKKALYISLNSTRLIRTHRYYGHFLWPPQCLINGFDCTYLRPSGLPFNDFFRQRRRKGTENIKKAIGLKELYH